MTDKWYSILTNSSVAVALLAALAATYLSSYGVVAHISAGFAGFIAFVIYLKRQNHLRELESSDKVADADARRIS